MTAYEMRISDWSSDGCSSGLPGRSDGATNPPQSRKIRLTSKTPIQHPDGVGREPEPKSPWPTADAREHTSRRTGTWNMRLTRRWRGLADRRSDQIGRASCRERVCQYV